MPMLRVIAALVLLAVGSSSLLKSQTVRHLGKSDEEILTLNRQLSARGAIDTRQLRAAIQDRAALLMDRIRLDPSKLEDLLLADEALQYLRDLLPDAINQIEFKTVWEGAATVTVEDDFEHGISRRVAAIDVNGETARFFLGSKVPQVRCGDRLRATGVRLGGLSGAISATVEEAAAAAGCSPLGTQTIAILLVNFGNVTLPPQVTATSVRDVFFGTSGHSLNGFFQEASYGKASAGGQVFGPFTLPQSLTCESYNAVRDAAIAAADATVDFRLYNRIVIVMPNSGTCGIGVGSIGCTSLTSASKGRFQSSVAWIRADVFNGSDSALQTIAHESGHNLGLDHASSTGFGGIPLGSPGDPGIHDEYGDYFSTMGLGFSFNGNALLGHYDAPHKSALGWLGASTLQTVEAGGTFFLQPYESTINGVQALRVRRGIGNNAWLWLEYRQPIGYDGTFQAYTSQVYSGATIHYEDPPNFPEYSQLLAFNPSAPGNFQQPALPGGTSWSDPYTQLSLTVGRAAASGLTVTVNYDTPCATLGASGAVLGASATSTRLTVSGPAGCNWTATSNASWITVTSGSSGSGSAAVNYSVSANSSPNLRTGSISIGRQTFTVTQTSLNPAPTPVSVSPNSGNSLPGAFQQFQFVYSDTAGANALTSVSVLFNITSNKVGGCFLEYDRVAGELRLWNDAANSWTSWNPGAPQTLSNAQCTVDYLHSSAVVSGQTLMLTVSLAFRATFTGVLTSFGEASDSMGGDSNFQPLGTWNVANVRPPFGVFDTPTSGVTGLAGAFAVGGWALSSVGVANITLWREPIGTEPTAGNGLVFMANATTIPGSRPDVAAAFPGYPNNNYGWGAQILTTGLPGTNGLPQGSGTYKIHAIATDSLGLTADIAGAITVSVNNAASALPFGTIDTPMQGGTASGTAYVNFGWILTPQPNIVPIDGSAVTVYIDNQPVGHPAYNFSRCDVSFQGLRNSGSTDCAKNGTLPGPVGFFTMDTTKLTNGLHTIQWGVSDSGGHVTGIGSRFFIVQN